MLTKLTFFLLILLLFDFTGYSQDEQKYILFEQANFHFPYKVWEPDKSWDLPKPLTEISGLAYLDENRLASVQDEKGNIYIFDLASGEIGQKIDFGDDGDYEGIEIIDDDAWVLKSNGTLYEVKNYLTSPDPVVTKYPTELSGKNDAEGLAFDKFENSLLIACKGHPFIDKKAGKDFKAVYKFPLETKQLNLDPYLLIVMDTIKYYKDYNTMTKLGIELLAYFDDAKGDLSFQPSGLAIHPLSGNIYVMGSVGNLLMVFSKEGSLLAMVKLRSKYYEQPEGICFSPDGTLFISNEGDEKKPNIHMFNPVRGK